MSAHLNTIGDFEAAPVAAEGLPTSELNAKEPSAVDVADFDGTPTEEELRTLRKVPAPMP
jgi:hypothetical protein